MLDLIVALRQEVRYLRTVHQPQSGGDRAHVRPHRRAIRREPGGAGGGEGTAGDILCILTRCGCLRCLPQPGRSKRSARLDTIPGFLPTPGSALPGCVFAGRCELADEICLTVPPPPHAEGNHSSRCHHWERAADLPRISPDRPEVTVAPPSAAGPALVARQVSKTFKIGQRNLRAVNDVSLSLASGGNPSASWVRAAAARPRSPDLLLGLLPPDAASVIELDGHRAASHGRAAWPRPAEGASDRLPEPGLGTKSLTHRSPFDRPSFVSARRAGRPPARPAAARIDLGRPVDRSPSGYAATAALRWAEAARRHCPAPLPGTHAL